MLETQFAFEHPVLATILIAIVVIGIAIVVIGYFILVGYIIFKKLFG